MFAVLFSPPQAAMGQYEVCTSTEGIDTVLAQRQSDGPRFTVSEADALNPLDAFGASGTYRRSKLARLYSGGRATVVRGWRQTGGTFESITLISPFPDVTLSRLMPGTMEIRFTYNFVLRQ